MNMIIPLEKIISDSKILIVDDSVVVRMLLVKIYQSAGFKHIEEACDGKDALDKIRLLKPDLVLIDMNMPHMDGLQVCHELKRLGISNDIVIIMQTASDSPELKVQAFKVGITDFVTKPANSAEVISRSVAHLERLFLYRQMEYNYQRVHKELKEASALQSILLPDKEVLESIKDGSGIDIAYHFQPVMELAGDYISVRKISGNRLALISVDVAGHGLAAALYAFSIHTLLEDKLLDTHDSGKILEILNYKLCDLMATGRFATMFLGVIDIENGCLNYAAAAAPPPILISKNAVNKLDTVGYLLGTRKDAEYVVNTIPLEKGDILFVYSDALIETYNSKENILQYQEIFDVLLENKSKDSSGLLKAVIDNFSVEYSSNLTDDLSIMVCKI